MKKEISIDERVNSYYDLMSDEEKELILKAALRCWLSYYDKLPLKNRMGYEHCKEEVKNGEISEYTKFFFPEDDPDDYFNVDKPTKAQHLTMLFDEDMTQAEKLKIIAVHYECSERTAMRYMEKFGLWTRVRGTKTKKDNTLVPTVNSSFSDMSLNGPKVTIQ